MKEEIGLQHIVYIRGHLFHRYSVTVNQITRCNRPVANGRSKRNSKNKELKLKDHSLKQNMIMKHNDQKKKDKRTNNDLQTYT
jgi:hypothetical protein